MTPTPTPLPSSKRLLSLDVFRGLTVASMMLVNNPGDWAQVYAPLQHATWHGWTFADLVFPFFLWIVGVAMAFSLAKRQERGDPAPDILLRMARRTAILFGLGLLLAGFPFGLAFDHSFSLATIRIPGVLQRIAVCYLLVGLLVLYTRQGIQFAATWLLLGSYWLLMTTVAVPDYGAGVLTARGNLAWYLDSVLLAEHTWSAAPTPGFDPEGLLSTLPAMATTLFGVHAGQFLRTNRPARVTLTWLLAAGLLAITMGLVANQWLPINKNLWTSSYALFMTGMAMIVFSGCFWLIDIQQYTRWTKPLAIYGSNALLLFFLSGLIGRLTRLIKISGPDGHPIPLKTFYYQHIFQPYFDPMLASLLHALAFVLLLYLIAYGLYRQRWFLTV